MLIYLWYKKYGSNKAVETFWHSQGQRSHQGHTMMLHTHNLEPTYLTSNYTLWFFRQSLDTILQVKVNTARLKVNSRSRHDATYLHHPNQCPYQVSTSCTLWFVRYCLVKILKVKVIHSYVKSQINLTPWHCTPSTPYQSFYKVSTSYASCFPRHNQQNLKTQSTKFKGSRSLPQGQKLNQCHTMTLHTHTTQPISLQHINFIHHAAFSDTPQTRFERSRSLKQGQRSGSQQTLSFVRYSQDNILNDKATKTRSNHGHTMIFKVTTARSKVKSSLHHTL